MKNWKQSVFFGVVAIIALGFAFIGCDDGNVETEQPIFREATINLTFGENAYTAKVQGTLLVAEWYGVADKIKNAINGAYTAGDFLVKIAFSNVFQQPNVKIIVGKRPTGKTFETIGDSITLYLNINAISKADFQQKIVDAVSSMNDSGSESN
jgi:hypothetical protein